MPAVVRLSLSQLTQIALGAPELGAVNISVLHSLLTILLRKLGCQDELVSVGGFEGKCLEAMLAKAKLSTVRVNDEQMFRMEPKEEHERVQELEARVKCLEKQLEQHFQQICDYNNAKNAELGNEHFRAYETATEDLCTVCNNPNVEIACALIQNLDFLKKMQRIVGQPMADRVIRLEEKIAELHLALTNFRDSIQAKFEELSIIGRLVVKIEEVERLVTNHRSEFLLTMEEVQDLLDSKLDKLYVPLMKKYIRDQFELLSMRISVVESKASCTKAAGVLIDGLSCISCGNRKVCAEVGAQTIGQLSSATGAKDPEGFKECRRKPKESCKCAPLRANLNIHEHMANLDFDNKLNWIPKRSIVKEKERTFSQQFGFHEPVFDTKGNLFADAVKKSSIKKRTRVRPPHYTEWALDGKNRSMVSLNTLSTFRSTVSSLKNYWEKS